VVRGRSAALAEELARIEKEEIKINCSDNKEINAK
jgi:hypothetical protein